MDPLAQFVWGFAGSAAYEIIRLKRACKSGRCIPKYFRGARYWLISLLVAAVAGTLSLAAQAPTPLLAMQLGVATPVIINRWSKERPASDHRG